MPDRGKAGAAARWFPVAGAAEVPRRHVFHAQLLGEELALWRADDDLLNAWENRCPHRGVRLTIGANLGMELRCQYHGMRFASGTGQCSFVPAHPDQPPPRAIHAKSYPVIERQGLIWVSLAAGAPPPEDAETTVLRSIWMRAPASEVARALAEYRFQPDGAIEGAEATCIVETVDEFTLLATARAGGAPARLSLFVQPVDEARSVVHGCLAGVVAKELLLPVLRHHSERLCRLRRSIEDAAAEQAATER